MSQGERVDLQITGMTCGHCVQHVTRALRAVGGVNEVDVSLESGRAHVTHDAGVSIDALVAAVEDEGYGAARGSDETRSAPTDIGRT